MPLPDISMTVWGAPHPTTERPGNSMAQQKCIIVYFNPEATDDDLKDVQRDIADEYLGLPIGEKMDYTIQGYSDGFGRIVSKDDTVHTIL